MPARPPSSTAAPRLPGTVPLSPLARAGREWLLGWWQVLYLGAVMATLALTPSTWRAASWRRIARHVYVDSAPVLPAFTLLSALVSLVIIRIVVVTALGYGLTRYALEMVVRVLVLELIPLTAALYAALRCTVPNGGEIVALRRAGRFEALRARGADPLRIEVLPRVVSGVFAVLTLALVSAAVALVLAYLSVYGFTAAALANYTRTVGQVFAPAVAMIFAMKTLGFALVVTLIPAAAALRDPPRGRARTSAELQGLVRMLVMIVLIEVAALVGNYGG